MSDISQLSPDDGDKIILNLVDKHKGKMIFIDIWNTWCGSCLAAMADHEQEKCDYTDKVAFVYLADETSPETLWNERIKGITGDHYRLPLDQHQSLMQRFNFQGYPLLSLAVMVILCLPPTIFIHCQNLINGLNKHPFNI